MSRPLQAPGRVGPGDDQEARLARLHRAGRRPARGRRRICPIRRIGSARSQKLKDAAAWRPRIATTRRSPAARVRRARTRGCSRSGSLSRGSCAAPAVRRRPSRRWSTPTGSQPGTPQIVMGLAELYLEARDFAKARTLAEAGAGARAPRASTRSSRRSRSRRATSRRPEIRRCGAGEESEARLPLLLLARVAARRGDLAAAIASLDRALPSSRRRTPRRCRACAQPAPTRSRISAARGGRGRLSPRDPRLPGGSRRLVAARAALRGRRPPGGVQGAARRDDTRGSRPREASRSRRRSARSSEIARARFPFGAGRGARDEGLGTKGQGQSILEQQESLSLILGP